MFSQFGHDRTPPDRTALVTLGVGAHQRHRGRDLAGTRHVPTGREVQVEHVRGTVDTADPDTPPAGPGVAQVETVTVDALTLAARAPDEEHPGSAGRDMFLESLGQLLAQGFAVEDIASPARGNLQQDPRFLVGRGTGGRLIGRLEGTPGSEWGGIDD